jgi:hypothetical protein
MNPLIFDNFAPDADLIRRAVIAEGFTDEIGPDSAVYTGISKYEVPHWYDRVSKVVGSKINPKLSCFRLNLAGENPHSWVHSDDICAKYASVLYLNLPMQCKGGTAFWRHKELGVDRLLGREELTKAGHDADNYYAIMNQEWKKKDAWQQTNMVPMKWNRFITYPTCFFHSRYPFEAFGSGSADGRLIWICFYDVNP